MPESGRRHSVYSVVDTQRIWTVFVVWGELTSPGCPCAGPR